MKKYTFIFIMLAFIAIDKFALAMQPEDVEETEEIFGESAENLAKKLFDLFNDPKETRNIFEFLSNLPEDKKMLLIDQLVNEVAEPSDIDPDEFKTFFVYLINNYSEYEWLHKLYSNLQKKLYQYNHEEDRSIFNRITQFFSLFNKRLAEFNRAKVLAEKKKDEIKVAILNKIFSIINSQGADGAQEIMNKFYKMSDFYGLPIANLIFKGFISRLIISNDISDDVKVDIIEALLDAAKKIFLAHPEVNLEFKDFVLLSLERLLFTGSLNKDRAALWETWSFLTQ